MKTNHQKTRNGSEKARMTGILQQVVAVILLTILAGSHVAAPTANAGFIDWLKGYTDEVQPIFADQGINQMFLGAPVFVPREASDVEPALTGSALIASSVINHEPLSATVRQRLYLEVSAYNSEVGQTDDSPFIMANGGHVHDGAVATNILPFGTRVKIPAYYGDKIFIVEDRMNRRYQNHMDIWMEHKSEALSFGRRSTVVEVIW
jgi:3D (Asp-Asp-Asp) domain-containing protein